MQEDTQDSIQENDGSLEDKQLRTELDLEERKYQYKIQLRRLTWYATMTSAILVIAIIAIISIGIFGADKSYIGGWSIFVCVVCVILLLILIIYFFWDTESYTGEYQYGFKAIKRIKDLIYIKEQIEELEMELKIYEKYKAARRAQTEKYKDEIFPTIHQYQLRANHNRRLYYLFQMVIIFCSLLVTGLTSGLTGLITVFNQPWITPAISFSVSFLTAMITLFRFRERGHNLQQTADAIEFEISCATRGIFGYKDLSEKDAYVKLAEEVERFLNEQRKRQQQLEQASDTSKHGTEGS